MSSYGKSLKVVRLFVLLIAFGLPFLLPQVRLYVAARLGSSDAMEYLAEEYYKIPISGIYGGMFWHDDAKGDYWRRRSAWKGNEHALHSIAQSWEHSNPHEVAFWLKHGVDLGIPWCAEKLALAHVFGRLGLPQDHASRMAGAREYDNLAVELHRKKGTLKMHECVLQPSTGFPQGENPEIHPGIPKGPGDWNAHRLKLW